MVTNVVGKTRVFRVARQRENIISESSDPGLSCAAILNVGII